MESLFTEFRGFVSDGPAYTLLMAAVVVECLVFVGFVLTLLLQIYRNRRRRERETEFEEAFDPGLREALLDGRELDPWLERARAYPNDIVESFLLEAIDDAEDLELQTHVVRFYREIGFVESDREALRSGSLQQRLDALRRLLRVATEVERELLLDSLDGESHLARIITGRILARIGSPDDLIEVFRSMRPADRLMEEPIYATFADLSDEGLEEICRHWDDFESPRLRRIVLRAAGERGLEASLPLMERAARDDDMEMRIGACDPLAMFEGRETLELLLELLEDDAWQVRARAASALGRRGDFGIVDPLAEAMGDPNFWVRQNAAMSLRQRGRLGLSRLEHIATESSDEFAADTASQELQRHELESASRGSRP